MGKVELQRRVGLPNGLMFHHIAVGFCCNLLQCLKHLFMHI